MKRISNGALGVANKYIAAKTSREFEELPSGIDTTELARLVGEGHVYEEVLKEIEFRYMTMTSMLYAGVGLGVTESYKKAMRKAFKDLLDN